MNNNENTNRKSRRAMTGVVKDNDIFAIITRDYNSWFINAEAHYYRRRTSFAGVFTGTYAEAQRLAKKHVNV